MKPSVTIETIAPDKARKWLEHHNKGNRRISSSRVEQLVKQIKDNSFRLSPDAVAFNAEGRLFNGQHRLHACMLSGKPIECIVMKYADPDSFMVTDIGIKKTGGHALGTLGYENPSHVASVCRLIWTIERDGIEAHWGAGIVSPLMVASVAEKYPMLEEIVAAAAPFAGPDKLRTSRTILSLVLWMASQAGHYDAMLAFLAKTASGIGLVDKSPELALRRRLAAYEGTRSNQLMVKEHSALICKAFIYSKHGKSISSSLRASPQQKFPKLTSSVKELESE